MKQNSFKTNVMRILDQHKINYKTYCYADSDAINGMEVASTLGLNPNQTFKTLVTVSNSKTYLEARKLMTSAANITILLTPPISPKISCNLL